MHATISARTQPRVSTTPTMHTKHQGIRAALCWNEELASLARAHNDANVLVMPGRFISLEEAEKITGTFLSTAFEGGRHSRRIAKIPVG